MSFTEMGSLNQKSAEITLRGFAFLFHSYNLIQINLMDANVVTHCGLVTPHGVIYLCFI